AAFCLSQAGPQNIWVDAKGETVAVLFRLAGAIAREGRRKALLCPVVVAFSSLNNQHPWYP
ncbi:hypothetical protein, partial [Aneurinibacillus aneurinilyticus]|uniref:hypothetical protein n=1 Tax=Aneurinibacillus aneurinilyticus TaxID=1391 RepID=UPI0023EFB1B4